MKSLIALLSLLLGALALRANPVMISPRPVRLVGECVEVQVLSNVAVVSGAYEFESWSTKDHKKVYLPVFVSAAEPATSALGRIHLEIEIGNERFEEASPCDPPMTLLSVPRAGIRVQWFVVDIDDHLDPASEPAEHAVIRLRYDQPLFAGVLYYVPLIVGKSTRDAETRDWNFQLHAVAASHALRVVSDGVDFERLAGGVVVFLRDRQIIALK